jgi:hypothetical protein
MRSERRRVRVFVGLIYPISRQTPGPMRNSSGHYHRYGMSHHYAPSSGVLGKVP